MPTATLGYAACNLVMNNNICSSSCRSGFDFSTTKYHYYSNFKVFYTKLFVVVKDNNPYRKL